MPELIFESLLTAEEIEENFKDISFFDGIMSGLSDALAFEKGASKHNNVNGKKRDPSAIE